MDWGGMRSAGANTRMIGYLNTHVFAASGPDFLGPLWETRFACWTPLLEFEGAVEDPANGHRTVIFKGDEKLDMHEGTQSYEISACLSPNEDANVQYYSHSRPLPIRGFSAITFP